MSERRNFDDQTRILYDTFESYGTGKCSSRYLFANEFTRFDNFSPRDEI